MQTKLFLYELLEKDINSAKKIIKKLPIESQKRILQNKNLKYQILSSIGEYIVRKYISIEKNMNSLNLNIVRDSFNKPYISNCDLKFNISHSKNIVACAISEHNIGVDIERCPKRYKEISERFFSKQENILIKESNNSKDEFLKLWTRKESYVKLNGEGINKIINKKEVFLKNVYFFEKIINSNFRICVCMEKNNLPKKIIFL